MHCTGPQSTQARSFTSMHASVMIAIPAMRASEPSIVRGKHRLARRLSITFDGSVVVGLGWVAIRGGAEERSRAAKHVLSRNCRPLNQVEGGSRTTSAKSSTSGDLRSREQHLGDACSGQSTHLSVLIFISERVHKLTQVHQRTSQVLDV